MMRLFLALVLAVVAHEVGHVVAARVLGVRLTAVRVAWWDIPLTMPGVALMDAQAWRRKVVFAAGGLVNLGLAWWLWGTPAAYSNLLLGIGSPTPRNAGETMSTIRTVDSDLWVTSNALYDGTDWYRVDIGSGG